MLNILSLNNLNEYVEKLLKINNEFLNNKCKKFLTFPKLSLISKIKIRWTKNRAEKASRKQVKTCLSEK